jgi:acetate---CoA ligase (ADP-forming)
MNPDLDRLLNPRSIAVVGASQDPNSLGARTLQTLIDNGYAGAIYPVHPRYTEVAGLTAYPSVREIPGSTDVAVIAVAAPRVAAVVEDCGAAGIPYAVILTSGFGEVGGDGPRLQQELVEVAARSRVHMTGPNSLGFLNRTHDVAAGFGVGMEGRSRPEKGGLGIVSQSGGMGLSLLNRATLSGLGVSIFVSTGNEADLTLVDFIEELLEDPETRVIAAYAETIRGADRLLQAGRRAAELRKPIVIAKIGGSEAGSRAVQSHTGSLAGADAVYEAAFREAGIMRVDDLEDLFDLSTFLLRGRVPQGDRVAVVTQSGGGGAWLADAIERQGMTLATASEGLQAELASFVPDFGSVLNPVDLTASGISTEAFASVIKTLSDSGEYDAIVVLMPLLDVSEDAIASLAAVTPLPILGFSHWLPTPALRPRLGALEVPYVTSPQRAGRVLAAASRLGAAWRRMSDGSGAVTEAAELTAVTTSAAGVDVGDDAAAFALLEEADLPVVAWRRASSRQEAVEAAAQIGLPVAMKLSVGGLLHKSDVGGVRVGLGDEAAVGDAWDHLATVAAALGALPRVLVQAMVPPGLEVIVGAKLDPTFGPVVMVGAGGVYAELLRDVSIRLAPVSAAEASAMLDELGFAALLHGARGGEPADVAALAEVVSRLSAAVSAWRGEIAEIDLNPVIVLPQGDGAFIVDVAIVRT